MELSSGDFYVTCFAIGAIVSILAAWMGLPFWLQIVVWAFTIALITGATLIKLGRAPATIQIFLFIVSFLIIP
jgi:membrane protein implicated in regulation of membrane protease activity